MGRWAQRTRSGGGASINFPISAAHDDPETLIIFFRNPIVPSQLNAADFQVSPSDLFGISVSASGANSVIVAWAVDISTDNFLNFNPTTPGFLAVNGMPIS